jgi:hypothetical protein
MPISWTKSAKLCFKIDDSLQMQTKRKRGACNKSLRMDKTRVGYMVILQQ